MATRLDCWFGGGKFNAFSRMCGESEELTHL